MEDSSNSRKELWLHQIPSWGASWSDNHSLPTTWYLGFAIVANECKSDHMEQPIFRGLAVHSNNSTAQPNITTVFDSICRLLRWIRWCLPWSGLRPEQEARWRSGVLVVQVGNAQNHPKPMLVDEYRHLYYLISHCHKPSWKSPLTSIVTWQTVLNTAQLGASKRGDTGIMQDTGHFWWRNERFRGTSISRNIPFWYRLGIEFYFKTKFMGIKLINDSRFFFQGNRRLYCPILASNWGLS